jgi:hypothetical protein
MISSQKHRNGTFLDDSTPIERSQDPSHEDGADPHDLSFSSSHAPRASMVENMAFALDQFSNPSFNSAPYPARTGSYDAPSTPRDKTHTFSSSIS